MAAVSPAGPGSDDHHLPRLGHRRPPSAVALGSVRWVQATRPISDEQPPTTRSESPHPAVEGVDGEQADEGDRQQDHGDHGGGEDDDPEHHGPGGQGERAHRPVPEQLHHGVDQIGAPGGQSPSRPEPGRSGRGGVGLRVHGVRIVRTPGSACRNGPVGRRRSGERQSAGHHADPDGARAGVGAHHRAEVGHHQRVLASTLRQHVEQVVDVEGRAVAHGQPADRGRVHGLVGQVAQRAAPGPLLGLLLHHAVDQRAPPA